MERLVYWSLLSTSLKANPLNDRQHGFRKGRSTDTALSMMVGRIEKALRKKGGAAIAVFLDIRGAFDNVNISFTSNALLERGFDPEMVVWYSHYLANRVVTAMLEGYQSKDCYVKGFLREGYFPP